MSRLLSGDVCWKPTTTSRDVFGPHSRNTKAAVISHLPSLRTDSPELLPWVRLHCLQEHPAATSTCLGCLEYSQNEVLGNLRAETFQVPISYMHNFGNSPHHQRKNAIYLQTVTVGHVKTTGTNRSFKSFLQETHEFSMIKFPNELLNSNVVFG